MISVVVPSFNEEEGIEAFLKSLCDQTLPRDQYEIIVVDGNSKDKTREIAEKYADKVFIQTSKKVGGARNDGVLASKYDLIVTTDADCFLPRPWLETIVKDFEKYPDASVIYGPIYPLEPGFKHKFEVFLYIEAGMYKVCDAGDDWELPKRMKNYGRVVLDMKMIIGFSMRRYINFGLFRSAFQWFYVVAKGGFSDKHQYMGKEYTKK